MKHQLTLIVILLMIASCKSSIKMDMDPMEKSTTSELLVYPEDELELDSLNSTEILRRLYDDPEFDSTGALWKPDFQERMDFEISFDGKCHTDIDTIMYFKNSRNTTCAVVLLNNYQYVKDYQDSSKIAIGGSHFTGVPLGIALFKLEEKKKWRLYCFEKVFAQLGYFGTYRTGREDHGTISLRSIGDNWTCLSLKQGVGGTTGVFWGYEMLFNIEDYFLGTQENDEEGAPFGSFEQPHLIFSYNYYYSACFMEEPCDVVERSIKFIPKKGDYALLRLTEMKNGKRTVADYSFSEQLNMFILKNK